MPANSDLERKLGSIEELLHRIEVTADPSLRSAVQELIELVMNLHGAGLERVVEVVHAAGEPGESIIYKLCRDELVGGLMVLYGIHPLPLEVRVTEALDKVRLRLRPYDADVELLSAQNGAVKVRLSAKAQGCGGTAQSLKQMVEDAVYQAAPDLTALSIDGAEENTSFVPLEMLQAAAGAPLALNGARKGGL